MLRNAHALSETLPDEARMRPTCGELPSVEGLRRGVELIREIVFSTFYCSEPSGQTLREYHIGVDLEELYHLMRQQIAGGLRFGGDDSPLEERACRLALEFIDFLPELKRLLYTDVEAIYNNDPSVTNYGEVVLCYPVVQAMIHYRVAHKLLEMGIPVIPRILTERAHATTGIDINPGAKIGEYFSIDHGTGVVIGETCIIGNHVTLYQGVTLGARNFSYDNEGRPVNKPRHPIIEDGVTIYSNSTVLGRITVGHNSVIGGNVWLTQSVPPYSRVLQSKATETERIKKS